MSGSRRNIGRYEVTAEVGRGSMGIVHLAHDPVMDRDVAIKTILIPRGLESGEREEFRERFLREAQAAGRLSHPGIVTVYDIDQEPQQDLPFIAMEYVEGPTLHELICAEGVLNPDWALCMAETLAGALLTARAVGVAHCDLKPANILVRESDGVAKIADFGLARVNATDGSYTCGSPAYLAPECIRGHAADTRSDLFSLAVILYEALSGTRPFGGQDFDTICHSITHDPPDPIRRHQADLSPAFERFFARALAKKPQQRFRDATDFRDAIRELRREQSDFRRGMSTLRIRPRRRILQKEEDSTTREAVVRRWRILGPASLFLVLISFAAGRGLRGSRPEDARLPGEPVPIPPGASLAPIDTLAATFEILPPVLPAVAEPDLARVAPVPETVAPAAVIENAWLELNVVNNIRSGSLTLLVDGREVYSAELSSAARKRKRPFGRSGQTFDARVEIPAGRHAIVARAFSAAKSKEYEGALEVELEPGESRSLAIVTGRTFGRRLSIKAE